MTKSLTVQGEGGAVAAPSSVSTSLMEAVLLQGDLAKLTPKQRVEFYGAVCESVGLNPLTKPFEYINLNGKLTLYATKNCTDQLRSINEVSVDSLEESERESVFVVTAKVHNGRGRTDMAKGAVSIASLRGESLANALMKAETKAKRRATLSICGLGMLDESEVDSVPVAMRVPVAETGDIEPSRAPKKADKFDVLKEFGKMKKAIGEADYRRILLEVGKVHKSSEFKDTEELRVMARRTWAAMEAFRREVAAKLNKFADEGGIPVFDKWPENFDGPMLRVAGVLYKYDDEAGNYRAWDDGLGVSEAAMPQEVSE